MVIDKRLAALVASQLHWEFQPSELTPKHPRVLLVVPGEVDVAGALAAVQALVPIHLYVLPPGGLDVHTLHVHGSAYPLLEVVHRGANISAHRLDLVVVWAVASTEGAPVDPWWRVSVASRLMLGAQVVTFGEARLCSVFAEHGPG